MSFKSVGLGALAFIAGFALVSTLCNRQPDVSNRTQAQSNTEIREQTMTNSETQISNSQAQDAASVAPSASAMYHGLAYSLLTNTQQEMYEIIYRGLFTLEHINLDGYAVDDASAAFDALRHDHPEIFWLAGCEYSYSADKLTLIPQLSMPKEQITNISSELASKTNQILSQIPASSSTYDKVLYVYEWIINNTDYRYDASHNQEIISVLINGESVCAGYSKAFQYLCHQLGIPCDFISGTIPERGAHAWNLVTIDGVQTYVDVTWGDPVFIGESNSNFTERPSYNYFCVTSEEISRNHIAETPTNEPPVCTSTEFDYFRQAGTYVESYSHDGLNELLKHAIDSGNNSLSVKLSSAADYQAACGNIESGGLFNRGIGDFHEVVYSGDKTMRIISIAWS